MKAQSKIITTAKRALLAGGPFLLSGFGKTLEDLGLEYKPGDGNTPRTWIDVNAQNAIVPVIKDNFPDAYVDAEESKEEVSYPESGMAWAVDPFDGTSNAPIKLPLSTSGLGVLIDGELVASCILDPFGYAGKNPKILWAEKGKGAHCADLRVGPNWSLVEMAGTVRKLETDRTTTSFEKRYGWIDSNFCDNARARKLEWLAKMGEGGFFMNARSTGSNISFSEMLALGWGHYQLTDTVGGYYDLCGAVLINEAGGKMFNPWGGKPTPKNHVAVAVANPKDFEPVLRITQECYGDYEGFR